MFRLAVPVAGLAFFLAGCAGQPIVYHRTVTTYSPGEFLRPATSSST